MSRAFKVKAGETYSMTVTMREGRRPKATCRRIPRPTCPLCLMRSWHRAALLCTFCGVTRESLVRDGIAP